VGNYRLSSLSFISNSISSNKPCIGYRLQSGLSLHRSADFDTKSPAKAGTLYAVSRPLELNHRIESRFSFSFSIEQQRIIRPASDRPDIQASITVGIFHTAHQ